MFFDLTIQQNKCRWSNHNFHCYKQQKERVYKQRNNKQGTVKHIERFGKIKKGTIDVSKAKGQHEMYILVLSSYKSGNKVCLVCVYLNCKKLPTVDEFSS